MKVLVVEDDRKVAGFIEQGLREEGYVVDVAADGEEATMLAHVYEYDIILLDVVLPKKNGFQVATELRREGRNVPILMLTSRDSVEDVVRGLDSGADDYLPKPFHFDELLARMRALSRRGGAERLHLLLCQRRRHPLEADWQRSGDEHPSRFAHRLCSLSGPALSGLPSQFPPLQRPAHLPQRVVDAATVDHRRTGHRPGTRRDRSAASAVLRHGFSPLRPV